MCVRTCVRAKVGACVHDVFVIYDNNILPRMIMIIIKMIILYFIQIRHTDDFPSTGTRRVMIINLTFEVPVSFYLFIFKLRNFFSSWSIIIVQYYLTQIPVGKIYD